MAEHSKKEAGVYAQENGGTAGRTHESVLEQTIGHRRMLRNMTAGGPPQRPTPKDAAPAKREHGQR